MKGSSQKSYRLFYAINIQMSYRFFYSTFISHTVLFNYQLNFQMSYHFFLVNLHISYKKTLNKPNQTFLSSLVPNPAGGNRGVWMYNLGSWFGPIVVQPPATKTNLTKLWNLIE